MIGILCNESEKETVREFFELFKTPWEFCIPGRFYEVVISTLQEAPQAEAKLSIILSSMPTKFDALKGIIIDVAVADHLIDHNGSRFPIYGKLAGLRGQGQPLIYSWAHAKVIVAELSEPHGKIVRAGYDLFGEVAFLLSEGQPVDNALIPTLELHISLLRDWIVDAGIPLVEIPPVPWGYRFIACLTHDVDFVGIRRHKLDHTFWGFVYRALLGSLVAYVKGRSSLARLTRNWMAVISLPLVYLGLVEDFWDQFVQYAETDKHFSSTFFLIPFKDRAGRTAQGGSPHRRAARYDIFDVRKQVDMLTGRGYEIGLHGIDAWLSADRGKQELKRIVETTGQETVGVRMHWLNHDSRSPAALDQAGFSYDSTCGYNETVGYRVGTTQVFRPLGVKHLLELPLHIQDTALFYPRRLALTEAQAEDLCTTIMAEAARYGGVVTVLWHLRSLAPERLWGKFYMHLLHELRERGAWFGTASQVVQWFRARRAVTFEDSFTTDTLRLHLESEGCDFEPRLFLRVHRPLQAGAAGTCVERSYSDIPWNGEPSMEIPLA